MSKLSDTILQDAWIGDAVLALYVRSYILSTHSQVDGAMAVRMTSNQFLSAFGEPSRVEAEIGRVYASRGLEAAFAWIQGHLLPLFEKQESNRAKRERS